MAEQAVLSPAGAASRFEADLENPGFYLNRELSWLRFDERVLEEAFDPANPLLERANFLAIFYSNLDEFFMVRVSGLMQQRKAGVLEPPPDGMTPSEQLQAIRERLLPLLQQADECWLRDLQPGLARSGIRIVNHAELGTHQQAALRRRFESEIFPVLTPLAFDPGHPFPHISSRSINLAVVVRDRDAGEKFARLKVPANFPRLLLVPDDALAGDEDPVAPGATSGPAEATLVWIEEVVAANLDRLFPGVEIVDSYPFRVTRNADFEIEEDEASDLLTAMAEVVGLRHFGLAIRLEIDSAMPSRIRDILIENLELEAHQVYTTAGPIGFTEISDLRRLDRPDLRYSPFLPVLPPAFQGERGGVCEAVRQRDRLLYHPYDSFAPVVAFVRQAASDPDVLAIKQTLYRVGPNSPIVEALMEARRNGKQVSALVELKARFDEESNIEWARTLDEHGVHVVYGVVGLKTHAKMCLVVRREYTGLRRYVHLSTGNYNAVTSRIYGDLGFFTCDADIAEDVSDLFNALTGYSRKRQYRKLLVAPVNMREEILRRIDREIETHQRRGGGRLAFKLNSLVDKACIQRLYRASQAGIRVDLQVRGICCLRPGVPGLSDNVTVTSVVGRFLEHARILYFGNGGHEELYLGSADLMPRNLGGRVEVLFPIENPDLLAAVRDRVLFLHLADNVKSRRLEPDGTYTRVVAAPGEPSVDSQLELLARPAPWHGSE